MGVDGGGPFDRDPSIPQDFGGKKEPFDPLKTFYPEPDPLGAMKLGEHLKREEKKRSAAGGDVRKVLEKAQFNAEANKIAKPMAENVSTILGQLLNRHRGETANSAIPVMELGLQSKKMQLRLVPSESSAHKGKLNAVEVVGMDGKVKRFRRVNPARLSEAAQQNFANKIKNDAKQQIDPNHARMDADREPPHERWQRIIKEGRDTDLWIPVGNEKDNAGQYLAEEPDLSHYIRQNLAKNLGVDQVRLLASKYKDSASLWDLVKQQEGLKKQPSERVVKAEKQLPSSQSKIIEEQPEEVAEEVVPVKEKGETKSIDKFTLIGTRRNERTEEIELKPKTDDAVFVGENKQGCRVIALADGVSGSDRGDFMSQQLIYYLSENSGSNMRTLKASVKLAHENAARQADRVDVTAASTLAAGVIDKDNKLNLVSRGDSPAYLLRDGKVILLNPIQNEKGKLVYEQMVAGKTRRAALKSVKEDYPNLKNAPKVFRVDDPEAPSVFERQIQLKPGDQLFFMTDGALDGCNTISAIENTIKKAAESDNPAVAMGRFANDGNDGSKPRDDISVGYMKI